MEIIQHTQLLVGLSKLNFHKFKNNFRDTINRMCLTNDAIKDIELFLLLCHFLAVPHTGPRREFLGPGSECCMGPLSNEFRKVRRRRTRAPEAHPPRGVRGHALQGKVLKVRLL